MDEQQRREEDNTITLLSLKDPEGGNNEGQGQEQQAQQLMQHHEQTAELQQDAEAHRVSRAQVQQEQVSKQQRGSSEQQGREEQQEGRDAATTGPAEQLHSHVIEPEQEAEPSAQHETQPPPQDEPEPLQQQELKQARPEEAQQQEEGGGRPSEQLEIQGHLQEQPRLLLRQQGEPEAAASMEQPAVEQQQAPGEEVAAEEQAPEELPEGAEHEHYGQPLPQQEQSAAEHGSPEEQQAPEEQRAAQQEQPQAAEGQPTTEHEQPPPEQQERPAAEHGQQWAEEQEEQQQPWDELLQQLAPAGAPVEGQEQEAAAHVLQGKTALVLDASTPLGTEIARALATAGAHVLLSAPDIEDAFRTAKTLKTQLPAEAGGSIEVPDLPLRYRTCEGPKRYAELLLQQHLEGRGLDLVVNNAAAGVWRAQRRWYTDKEGVAGEAQADFMAPYILLRCLEPKLRQSHTRIVTVVSPLNRCVQLPGSEPFLFQWLKGSRLHAQLASVVLTAELQRRLGPAGVQACVADAGVPSEQVLGRSLFASLPPFKQATRLFWTPAAEGAETVMHAATDEWGEPMCSDQEGGAGPATELRYYAAGLLTSPLITSWDGSGRTLLSLATWPAYTWLLLLHAVLAHRLRTWVRKRLGDAPRRVKGPKQAYDAELGADLWEVAGLVAGIEKLQPATPAEGKGLKERE